MPTNVGDSIGQGGRRANARQGQPFACLEATLGASPKLSVPYSMPVFSYMGEALKGERSAEAYPYLLIIYQSLSI